MRILGCVVVVVMVGACPAQAPVGVQNVALAPNSGQVCASQCAQLQLELDSVVVMANNIGCVCRVPVAPQPPGAAQPPGATPPSSARRGAASAGGFVAVMLHQQEEEARERAADDDAKRQQEADDARRKQQEQDPEETRKRLSE